MKLAKSNDRAVLEAIERDLVAKQQAFLVENSNNSSTRQLNSKNKIDRDNKSLLTLAGCNIFHSCRTSIHKTNGGGKQPDEIRLSMAVWMEEWTRY